MSSDHSEHEQYPDYKKPPYDREIDTPAITKLVIGLLLVAVASFVGMWWMYEDMKSTAAEADPVPGPFAQELSDRELPAPRLQSFPPHTDIERLREEEATILTSYEEEGAGDVKQYRIPLDRAIEILVDRGLPGQGNVDEISEELFGDQPTVADSAQVGEAGQDGEGEEP